MDPDFPTTGRIAGIDYGTVRIGFAITDPGRVLASPHENYTRRTPEQDAARFRDLVAREGVVGFVVGLPVHASGEESAKSLEARRFGKWLHDVTGVPVRFHDERFTSVQAEQLLGAAQFTKKRRQRRLDMVAAQIMLASFLETTGHPPDPNKPLDG